MMDFSPAAVKKGKKVTNTVNEFTAEPQVFD